MQEDEHGPGNYQIAPHKSYRFRQSEPEAFMVELAQWKRIRTRVDSLDERHSIGWLLTAASTAGSIGVGALIAVLALPASGGTTLGRGVVPTLWAIAVAGIVLGLAMTGLWVWARDRDKTESSDICAEMDTVLAAWEERGSDFP
jgi:hypothetical protein